MKHISKFTFLILITLMSISLSAQATPSAIQLGAQPILKNDWANAFAPNWKMLLKQVKIHAASADYCANLYIKLQEADDQLNTLRLNGELDESSYLSKVREFSETMKKTDEVCKKMVGREKQNEIRAQALDS